MKNHHFGISKIPRQMVLIILFVLQIFGAVGLVGYLSFKNGQKAVNDLAEQLMDRTSNLECQTSEKFLQLRHR
ncbi:hypothetical protein [Nostoc sp.]|uniref:hypothetical protein n=1 Tax=Nostoc sp. TaxID=1180 RepID=UPI002FF86FED